MFKVAIFGHSFEKDAIDDVQQLFDALGHKQCGMVVYQPFLKFISKRIRLPQDISSFNKGDDAIIENVDYFFCLGGDGTMLDAVTIVKDSGIPILGINTGRLGFLASTQHYFLEKVVQAIVDKKFRIDCRTLLSIVDGEKSFANLNFALNELTVLKTDTSSMISINILLNGEQMNTYWADGLIISTPTGSTAYSLSCGGPIISPDSSNLAITPISPHNLNVRPVVVPDDNEIILSITGRSDHFLAALDSRSVTLANSIELKIRKADFKINLIQLLDNSFLRTLRSKMMWGVDKRN